MLSSFLSKEISFLVDQKASFKVKITKVDHCVSVLFETLANLNEFLVTRQIPFMSKKRGLYCCGEFWCDLR